MAIIQKSRRPCNVYTDCLGSDVFLQLIILYTESKKQVPENTVSSQGPWMIEMTGRSCLYYSGKTLGPGKYGERNIGETVWTRPKPVANHAPSRNITHPTSVYGRPCHNRIAGPFPSTDNGCARSEIPFVIKERHDPYIASRFFVPN